MILEVCNMFKYPKADGQFMSIITQTLCKEPVLQPIILFNRILVKFHFTVICLNLPVAIQSNTTHLLKENTYIVLFQSTGPHQSVPGEDFV